MVFAFLNIRLEIILVGLFQNNPICLHCTTILRFIQAISRHLFFILNTAFEQESLAIMANLW